MRVIGCDVRSAKLPIWQSIGGRVERGFIGRVVEDSIRAQPIARLVAAVFQYLCRLVTAQQQTAAEPFRARDVVVPDLQLVRGDPQHGAAADPLGPLPARGRRPGDRPLRQLPRALQLG